MSALANAPQIGVRSADEIVERFLRQASDATAYPLSKETCAALEAALSISVPLTEAPSVLRARVAEGGLQETAALTGAIDGLAARIDALRERNVALETLRYDADFGRNLEYYDGFVFEMQHRLPDGGVEKLGGGGRYDKLFKRLSPQPPITGVGAALRPEAVLRTIDSEGAA